MILEKLIVENFRQYYGKQEIVFSTLKTKNVTVLHAENGVGKTALLNALLWGFFGTEGLTEDFEHPTRIIHETLALGHDDPANVFAKVIILFKDDEKKYILTRSINLLKQNANDPKNILELELLQSDGQMAKVDNPQWKINTLIPKGISPFLFFNGEKIDELSRSTNAGKIKEAIYQMLGLEILKRTIDDLEGRVSSILSEDLRRYADANTKELLDQEKKYKENLQEIESNISACQKEQEAIDLEEDNINKKLLSNKKTRELQEKRDRLLSLRNELEDKQRETIRRIEQIISTKSYVLFAEEVVKRAKAIAAAGRNKGKIPARVLNNFIEELLSAHRCICKRELNAGSHEYDEVRKLLTIAGDSEFNEAVHKLDSTIAKIEGDIEHTRGTLLQEHEEREKTRTLLRQIDQELDEIHELVGSKEDEEVKKLEGTLEKLSLRRREQNVRSGQLSQQKADTTSQLDEVKRKISSIQQKAEEAEKASRRLSAANEAAEVLKKIFQFEMDDIRNILNKEIGEHFKKVVFKDFRAELGEDFVLHILKKVPVGDGKTIDVAKSMGENQITSLVFIGSLLNLAKRRDEIPTILKGLEGGEYPICMDSPFGQLGPEYRFRVAELIPKIAPQVIIFVSQTQWRGEVEEKLGDRVGKHYLLTYHGPKPLQETSRQAVIAGKKYPQYRENSIEFTKITEVES